MATETYINQVPKQDYYAAKIDYTDKDYVNILDDLINSIPGISKKWQSTDENDPGMILVKLMAILGDMLFFNLDMASLEVYPNSVTLRKNAAVIYRLIGYKMKWYRSATLQADVVNTYSSPATMPRFCTFTTQDKSISYTTFEQYELKSNTANNGAVTTVELIQGTPVTPSRISNNPFPDAGKPWHSIYGYNYTTDDMIDNKIYLKDNNVDQNHLILVDNQNEVWTLVDNVYLQSDTGRYFEFDVDVNDNPYIELVDYWKNYNVNQFKIFYIKSSGSEGQIYANTLTKVSGNVWSRVTENTGSNVYNVNNFIQFTHFASGYGYDPETPDEARKESVKYQNTLDTLITLADFERATLRIPGVANVRATDLTNDPGMLVTYHMGDINQDGVVDELDLDVLRNYLADKDTYPLTAYQFKLADLNQDGKVDSKDEAILDAYLHPTEEGAATGDASELINAGETGISDITERQLLEGFTVKLYILPTEEFDNMDEPTEENFLLDVQNQLKAYKILPLTIVPDLESINRYYWTIKGTFFTKQPLSRDELQTIILNINNQLKYQYSRDRVNFNTQINYREVIEVILAVDNRILMVDLDPITYIDSEGNEISKEQLTGKYTYKVPLLTNENAVDNLEYKFTIPNAPLLPGSVLIRINDGQYTVRDNNNGIINNSGNVLSKNGKINYITGEVELTVREPLYSELIVDYTHNATNIALYNNLSTQTFYFDSSSLKSDDVQDIL